jgi:hypothetical protein
MPCADLTDDHYTPNENPCVLCKVLDANYYEAGRSLKRWVDLSLANKAYSTDSLSYVEVHVYRTIRFLKAKEALRKHICYRKTQWFR